MSTSTAALARGPLEPGDGTTPRRPRSPGAVAVLVVGALVAGAAVADGALALVTVAVRQHASGSATLDGVTAVEVDLADCGGDVDVRPGAASAGAAARVSWRDGWGLRRPEHSQVVRDGRLLVRVSCPGLDLGWGASSDLALLVPAAAPVTVSGGSGDVSAAGLAGDLVLHTGSGDVRAERVSGDLDLATGSGDVGTTGTRSARVLASTGSGDTTLRSAVPPQRLRARSGSGDVVVEVPDDGAPYAVTTRTGSGDEHVGVADDPRADRSLVLSTGSGDLTVRSATP
jgi:Putative adhesin